jgi:hypothetical protein
MRRQIALTAIGLGLMAAFNPSSASAQDQAVSLRPFFMVAAEKFSAKETFSAVFGSSVQPVYGGGVEVAFRNGLYFDVTASRFKKTGERAFFFNGEGFGLDIPLTATVTPVEFTVGARTNPAPNVYPYFGGGIGSYKYKEESEFDEDFSKSHLGWLIVLGVEYRFNGLVAISGDVQYTQVHGIIGAGGVSLETGESDLGGTAGRFRILVGR